MKLEEGKYYVTRSGERVRASYDDNGIMRLSNGRHVYTATGRGNGTGIADTETDITSEWSTEPKEGPIREVRRREIVPGVYGRIMVSKTENRDEYGDILIQLCNRNGVIHGDRDPDPALMTAQELREAAHILNQLAEYLEGEK